MAGTGRFARRRRDRQDDHLPLPAGPISNGEFVPAAAGPRARAIDELVRRSIDESARRLGVDRRRFLQGVGAVAASLAAFELAGCSAPATTTGRAAAPRGRGGTFAVATARGHRGVRACVDGVGEFIVDVHTHHVIPDGPWVENAPETTGLGAVACCRPDCTELPARVREPCEVPPRRVPGQRDHRGGAVRRPQLGAANAPIPFPDALSTQPITAGLTRGGASRLLVQNIIAPNVGTGRARRSTRWRARSATGPPAAFKVYTAWGPNGQGYSLEDPTIGLPVIQHAHDLGVKVFVAHKGLPLVNFDPAYNGPDDIVAVSRQFPDMQFVVFHGAWDPSHVEGPYDPSATLGIDTPAHALDRHDVPPNDNVWVDVATVWRQLLTQPDQAAHAIGKLLSRVGAQRVLWGTDAIWYGSPEPQIMAMQAFEITPEFQDTYRYPALTDELKADLFGLNAVEAVRPRPDGDPMRPRQGSVDVEHPRGGAIALRGRAAFGVATERTDHAPPGPALAGLGEDRMVPALAEQPGGRQDGEAASVSTVAHLDLPETGGRPGRGNGGADTDGTQVPEVQCGQGRAG